MLSAFLLLAAAASAEPLAEKVEREYTAPVFEQVKAAAAGAAAPDWTPPGPVTPAAMKFTAFLRGLTDPLALHAETQAGAAARRLASPTADFEDAPMPSLDFAGMIGRWMRNEGLVPEKKAEPAPPAVEPKRADSLGLIKGRALGGGGKTKRLRPQGAIKPTEIKLRP